MLINLAGIYRHSQFELLEREENQISPSRSRPIGLCAGEFVVPTKGKALHRWIKWPEKRFSAVISYDADLEVIVRWIN